MGLLTTDEIRGLKDEFLPTLTDQRLIMLALARLFEGEGVDDEALIRELYRRGRTLPYWASRTESESYE